MLTSLCQDSKI